MSSLHFINILLNIKIVRNNEKNMEKDKMPKEKINKQKTNETKG